MPAPKGGHRGSFKPGNPGNPNATGRPPRAFERRFLEQLTACVSDEAWRRIVETAIAQAERGDTQARLWLSKHLVGEDPLAVLELMDRARSLIQRLERGQASRPQGTRLLGTANGGAAPPHHTSQHDTPTDENLRGESP